MKRSKRPTRPKRRSNGRKPVGSGRTRIDPAELKRAAKLARSYLPRGADRIRGRRMSDQRVVVEALLVVAGAAGKLWGTWSEFPIRAMALVLADIDDREAAARAVRAWRAVEKLSAERRRALRKEIARQLSEEAGEEAAAGVGDRHRRRAPTRRRPTARE